MEEDWKPFEIRETEEGTTLYLHGTEESRVKVEADKVAKILEAIKRGWNVDIQYSIIDGGIDIRDIGLEQDESGRLVIARAVQIRDSDINGLAYFERASFNAGAYFGGASFNGLAYFSGASFIRGASFVEASFRLAADFIGAVFDGPGWFSRASFKWLADFEGASINGEADFEGASFTNEIAYFRGVNFKWRANFSGASFSKVAVFEEANFNGEAIFCDANFSAAYFSGASFNELADFSRAGFKHDPRLREIQHEKLLPDSFAAMGLVYRKSMLSGGSYFFEKAGHGYWDSGDFSQASEAFRDAKLEYEKEGKYDEAGVMYVWEKDSTRRQLWHQIRSERSSFIKRSIKWLWLNVWKVTCNYGEAPLWFIGWAAFIITQVATYKHRIANAMIKRTIFSSNPLDVTA